MAFEHRPTLFNVILKYKKEKNVRKFNFGNGFIWQPLIAHNLVSIWQKIANTVGAFSPKNGYGKSMIHSKEWNMYWKIT